MKKTVKAVEPYIYKGGLNFKNKPFEAWKELGLPTVKGWYPRWLHWLLFRYDIFPSLWQSRREARLVFVQPINLYLDAGPSVISHEVIPFFWDCWPRFYEKVGAWLRKHNVKTAIFACRETYYYFKKTFPDINVIYCYEGIDSRSYYRGEKLMKRDIDILEFGRGASNLIDWNLPSDIRHICTRVNDKFLFTDEELYKAMSNSKVTICFPQSMTNVAKSGGIETLTQRYWECMFSRIVIVGHCPQELVDILGYNPVIELKRDDDNKYGQDQVLDVLNNIDNYQSLVDKNYIESLKYCDWKKRVSFLQEELKHYK